jgi:hypothetical protein
VEAVEGEGAVNLGRERAEGEAPRWTELGGTNGGRRGTGRARGGPISPFIGNGDGGEKPGRVEPWL